MRGQNLLGQQVGNYRLTRLLGRGGFAEVYLGEHLHLGTQTAIKVLYTALDDKEVEHFRAEARIVAHLVHPHIVQVLEFGVEYGIPYLVMRYAPGGTLRHRHPRGSRVPLPTIVTYVKQVASALQYAHNERVIHRDVKPENMLIGSNGEILLSDFGIATVVQSSRHHDPQQVAGTAIYMAPEQFRGEARIASDQYALGVVVYEWLSGERPFKGSFSEIASQHLLVPPAPLRERVADIPPVVEQVVLKAMAKDPAARFGSIWEFATAFEWASATYLTDGLTLPSSSNSTTFSLDNTTRLVEETGYVTPGPQSGVTPRAVHEASSPVTEIPAQKNRPGKRGLSRRTFVVGCTLTSLAGIGIAAGVLARFGSLNLSFTETSTISTARPTPTLASTPTPTPSPTSASTSSSLGTKLYTYRGHTNDVEAATWSPHSKRIATGSRDKTVQVWNATDGGNVLIYKGHSDIVDAVGWSSDSKRIVSASLDKTVQIWDAANGHTTLIYTGHTDKVAAATWSPDGKYIASGGTDTTVQVWLATNGALTYKFTGHSAKIWSVIWSPDGKRIASASADGTVKVWDAANGGNVFVYTGHTGTVYTAVWSPDGKRIASCGNDKTVQVWDAANGGNVFIYRGHSDIVWTITWSPDGKRIASASNDQTVQVWDAANGGNPYTYRGQSTPLYFASWSPDGKYIVSGGSGRDVQVWRAI